ncbi:unnamed protein product [Brassicogethes aeneus]|uniref:Uncharacterized protein n=1 Tax=Brassicogethes aeneus TaxID=1431903 RepID=A0A9P0BKN4_BRAAE|nr:unnamed protein product [Brassicogethes aeneus]
MDGTINSTNEENEEIRARRFRNLPSVNAIADDLNTIITQSDEPHLLSTVRRRVQVNEEKVEIGSLNVLSAKYEWWLLAYRREKVQLSTGILRFSVISERDHEKRDFVSGGAAAGVSAAFGAPVGGVLFSFGGGYQFLEPRFDMADFFSPRLSALSTLNFVLSAYHGVPGNLNYPGLLNLGEFENFKYQIWEIPIFILMGAFGGITGGLLEPRQL